MKLRHLILLLTAATIFASCGDNTSEAPKYKLTPPTGAVKAEPGIIGVDSKGELTLDGWKADNEAFIVYFKWGSLIAMKGDIPDDEWTDGITDIAWVPDEYKSKLGEITNYASVPYAESGVFPTDSPAKGLGDPCHFAKKDGLVGEYRMPNGNPYEKFTDAGWEEIGGTLGQPGRNSTEGQFYPAAGNRFNSTGTVELQDTDGYYWSSKPLTASSASFLYFSKIGVDPLYNANYAAGFAVRCVRIVN